MSLRKIKRLEAKEARITDALCEVLDYLDLYAARMGHDERLMLSRNIDTLNYRWSKTQERLAKARLEEENHANR